MSFNDVSTTPQDAESRPQSSKKWQVHRAVIMLERLDYGKIGFVVTPCTVVL